MEKKKISELPVLDSALGSSDLVAMVRETSPGVKQTFAMSGRNMGGFSYSEVVVDNDAMQLISGSVSFPLSEFSGDGKYKNVHEIAMEYEIPDGGSPASCSANYFEIYVNGVAWRRFSTDVIERSTNTAIVFVESPDQVSNAQEITYSYLAEALNSRIELYITGPAGSITPGQGILRFKILSKDMTFGTEL